VPHRTGRAMSVETIVRLATDVPHIVALKDARGNPAEAARIVAEAPDDFDLYSGDDTLTLPLLAVGAVGCVGVATHWCGVPMGEMIAAFERGDHAAARAIHDRIAPTFGYQSSDLWQAPGAVKTLLGELGLPSGPCRLPLAPVPAAARERAQEIIAALEVTK
jgi:4-hydroxy-tetrahydrodipicolinate synthase